jgi:hypothetical protein
MTTPSEEPLEQGSEADVVEQTQDLDGSGSVGAGPDVTPEEANVADAVEQGANVTTEDDDAYPHSAEESE